MEHFMRENIINELLELSGNNDLSLFSTIVGNPPYQVIVYERIKDSERVVSTRIYPQLQKNASGAAINTCLIYPSSWQSSLQKDLGYFLLHNGLHTVYTYSGDHVFGNHIIKGYPVAIVHCQKDYSGMIHTLKEPIKRNSLYWNESLVINELLNNTKNYNKLSLKINNPLKLSNIEDSGIHFSADKNSITNAIRVYIKKRSGVQADADYYYAERSELEKFIYNNESIDQYSVAIPSRVFKQNRLFKYVHYDNKFNFGAKIFPPGEIFGSTYIELCYFKTYEEAINFCTYFNSYYITLLASLVPGKKNFVSMVPDIKDYATNSVINWNNNINSEIEKLFNLSGSRFTSKDIGSLLVND